MNGIYRKIDKLGRIVLPMNYRKALGLEGEATVSLCVHGDQITVRGIDQACKLCGSIRDVSKKLRVCADCIKSIRDASL